MLSQSRSFRPWADESPTGTVIDFFDSTWQVGDIKSGPRRQDGDHPYEQRAVYECFQLDDSGRVTQRKAALKTKSEIRYDDSTKPSEMMNELTQTELRALEQLTALGCQHSPTLIHYKIEHQDESGIFPGAYICFLLMTWIPGIQPLDFWDYPFELRDRIRRAFKIALSDVHRCGVNPEDTWPRNLLWDDSTDTCYIMDYEDALTQRLSWLTKYPHRYRGSDWLYRWSDEWFAAWRLVEPVSYGYILWDGSDLASFDVHPSAPSVYRANYEALFNTPAPQSQAPSETSFEMPLSEKQSKLQPEMQPETQSYIQSKTHPEAQSRAHSETISANETQVKFRSISGEYPNIDYSEQETSSVRPDFSRSLPNKTSPLSTKGPQQSKASSIAQPTTERVGYLARLRRRFKRKKQRGAVMVGD